MKIHKNRRGFTLVELSIVLIIIGILLTAVLKGQELITNARLKRIKDDVDKIQSAVLTFQDRYKALPGDREDDTRLNWGWNGNGDGFMGDDDVYFWKDLFRSEILPGDYTRDSLDELAMRNPYNGYYLVEIYENRDALVVTNIPNRIAWMLDHQYDDGVRDQGTIRSDTIYDPDSDERVTMYWYIF